MNLVASVILLAALAAPLRVGNPIQQTLERNGVHNYTLQLRRGEIAEVVVKQEGVDVIVDLFSPQGVLLDSIDGPTGRAGEERVEVVAGERGAYELRVRPYNASEPAAAYTIELRAHRNVRAARALLDERQRRRNQATEWLRQRASTVDRDELLASLARRARVIGLGEATHGSREFGDLRLALTKRLVENHGVRLVALEASAEDIAAMEPYLRGEGLTNPVAESGWIGRRTMRELVAWIRKWNRLHPADRDRVTLVGTDAQGNARSRALLGRVLKEAYGDLYAERWAAAEKELATADEQTLVFGDSSVKAAAHQLLLELVARLTLDGPLLRKRGINVEEALDAARTLAQFADFNSSHPQAKSRDWFMAVRVLQALDSTSRAVYWAHNAHVAVRGNTTGGFLRSALGCQYAAVALTFGQGSFVAQIPNGEESRLAVFSLPTAVPESIEQVMAPLASDRPILAAWDCEVDRTTAPDWLRSARAMHWIGGVWTPGNVSSAARRDFDLLHDFDAIIYIPNVHAEEIPPDFPPTPRRNARLDQ